MRDQPEILEGEADAPGAHRAVRGPRARQRHLRARRGGHAREGPRRWRSPPSRSPPLPAQAKSCKPVASATATSRRCQVKKTSCGTGKTVAKAFTACRHENGKGRCTHKVKGTVRERSAARDPDGVQRNVTCKKGTQAGEVRVPAEHVGGCGGRLLLAALAAAPAHAAPACFAAAARDPEKPCSNPALRSPPARACRAPCSRRATRARAAGRSATREAQTARCPSAHFGVPGRGRHPHRRADRRQPRDGLARARSPARCERLGWHGIDMTRSHCAFSAAVRDLAEPEEVTGCVRFNLRVIDWLDGRTPRSRPRRRPPDGRHALHRRGTGLTSFESETLGFADRVGGAAAVGRAGAARSATTRADHNAHRVAALHPPRAPAGVPRALLRAAARGVAAPRRLLPARRGLGDPRYALVDLTDFFCSTPQVLPGHRRRARHQGRPPPHARLLRQPRALPGAGDPRVVSPYFLPSCLTGPGRARGTARGARRPARG